MQIIVIVPEFFEDIQHIWQPIIRLISRLVHFHLTQ